MARLIVEHENRPPQHFPLNRTETFIGRGDDSDLLLPDVSVSRKHCCVRETPDGYELEDLKSANGTLLNGRKMMCKALFHGDDKIQVGKFVLSFEAPAGDMEVARSRRGIDKFSLEDERPAYLARLSAIDGPTAQSTSRLDAKGLKAARIAARMAEDARIVAIGMDEKEYSPGVAGIEFGKNGIPTKGLGMGAKVRIQWNGKAHVLTKESGMMTRVEVNGEKVKSQELNIGDEITVGRSAFIYRMTK